MSNQQNQNGTFTQNVPSQSPSQYYQQPQSIFVDKINDMLSISVQSQMDERISKNTINIIKIFQYFQNNVYDGTSVTKEEVDKLIHCLKFVDTLNLFMPNQAIYTLMKYMFEIYDIFSMVKGMEAKEQILKQIKYTEMTVITLKKKIFKQLYFGDPKLLANEIEHNLEMVNKNGKFDQKLFKQLQNLFYVVQGKFDEGKKIELQQKFNDMKAISIKFKKQRYSNVMPNLPSNNYYDEYNDYPDYKNYSNVSGNLYDYNDNFYQNDNYYDDGNNEYGGYYQDKYFYRHQYRGHHRKYFENEEKEVEITAPTQEGKPPSNDIEVIQSVVPTVQISQDNTQQQPQYNKNYYGINDTYHPGTSSEGVTSSPSPSPIETPVIASDSVPTATPVPTYNTPGFKKKIITKKNMKQRGITLVEVPVPDVVEPNVEHPSSSSPMKNEDKPELSPQPNNSDETEVITTVVRNRQDSNTNKHGKYYHNNTGYKTTQYGKNNYYQNYNNNYYHGTRDGYYHGGYQSSQGNSSSGENVSSYYKRGVPQGKKYYNNSTSKPKHDFVEIVDVDAKPQSKEQNQNDPKDDILVEDIKPEPKEEGKPNDSVKVDLETIFDKEKNKESEQENIILPIEQNEDNDNKINEIDFQQTFIPPNPNEYENPNVLSDNNIPEDYEEEENEDEGQESSDSVDNEVLTDQFKEFIKDSMNGNEIGDDTYYLKESDKNNKVVFEDDEEDNSNDNNSEDIEEKILKAQEELNHQPTTDHLKKEDPIQEMFNEDININALLPVINQLPLINQDDTNKAVESPKPIQEEVNTQSQTKVEQPHIELLDSNDSRAKPEPAEIHSGNKYKDSVKSIDPKILSTIKNKLSEDYNNQENKTQSQMQSYLNYQNNFQQNQMLNPAFISMITNYQRQFMNNKLPLQSVLSTNYTNFFYRCRDANIHREYATLKYQETERNQIVKSNLNTFESKILIPLYQRINFNVNKKRGIYYYTFLKYKKLIQKTLGKDKLIKKVKPYGSYMNNFMIDTGDIDICIVPKCPILDFSESLGKIKEEITARKYGEFKLIHHTERYLLLKIMDNQTKFIVDITVHTMLPIQNTSLIRLYSLYDQRFHILGLYIKHWAKINKIHGAADNYLSSYALLLMLIHFLQKVVEPKVLPNLQRVDKNKTIDYEYVYNQETIKTNIYYEEDLYKIREYMNKVNGGKENKESAASLLIKFFEYYSYFFDSEQKISINKELSETMKTAPDNIAFSIEDPFDIHHNPGKSMTLNSMQYYKFTTAMKKEINFILNGEYVKRLEKILSSGNNSNNTGGINEKSN